MDRPHCGKSLLVDIRTQGQENRQNYITNMQRTVRWVTDLAARLWDRRAGRRASVRPVHVAARQVTGAQLGVYVRTWLGVARQGRSGGVVGRVRLARTCPARVYSCTRVLQWRVQGRSPLGGYRLMGLKSHTSHACNAMPDLCWAHRDGPLVR